MSHTAGSIRKQRVSAFITRNASARCRKKRTKTSDLMIPHSTDSKDCCLPPLKCDGQNLCARCAALDGVTCNYDVTRRASRVHESTDRRIKSVSAGERVRLESFGCRRLIASNLTTAPRGQRSPGHL